MAPIWGGEQRSTTQIQAICTQLKPDVEKHLQKTLSDFIAVKFIHQVPEDIHYIIKVQGGVSDWLHVKVFQDLPCFGEKVTFEGCQYPKLTTDPIIGF